ncbi:ABC transporter ATP-binding protein [Halovulum dunhuangense]|uniref:ABC transporter ATP-binding protein n=1 Tax=Halovulum dunhuangense TaxID=1505036 RepID=A0A849L212_9RHOB|nr:ABC transporter ATP-binding protein [Halovulum dunhuangense]NNU80284.1 ABC transporter ATP-binding protein [Halovulum dunhuangense]
MAFLELERLQKFYGKNHVVKDFNLSVEKGEFISFLGPSGCGKTTTLRMVAGFETPSEGSIRIDGQDVVKLRPNQRQIGMVFQSYALFPNMTVAQNVGFGLRVAGVPRPERDARVAEMLALIGLPDLGGRYPSQLSGGQQQRVALARALAVRPQVLLLDEPLSALDAKIRVSLRAEIRNIQRELGITTIYVTHDQEEALSMSDRIVVMHDGIAQQVGEPFEIYNRPATRFVATFVGTLNSLGARVLDPDAGRLELSGVEVALGRAVSAAQGARIDVALRPEVLSLDPREGCDVRLPGTVEEVSFLGSVVRIRVALASGQVQLDAFNDTTRHPPRPGDACAVHFSSRNLLL